MPLIPPITTLLYRYYALNALYMYTQDGTIQGMGNNNIR